MVIDELPTLLGARAAEGRVDVATLLVPALARGEMQCIGATTLDEYRTYIQKDPALQHHFQEVIVHELISEETILNPSSGERGSTRSKEMMSGAEPHGRPALTLHPGQVPAFTADDMKAYLQGAPSCSLGPTLSGEPPTVESVEFATYRELRNRLNTFIGHDDDALACYVVLRGPFLLRGISYPPGGHRGPAFGEIVEEIYDASTGSLLVVAAGSFKPRPGWPADWRTRVNAPPRPQPSVEKSVSREQMWALIETPDSFIVWLRGFTPDAEVASIYDPVHSMLAEYVWATLEAFSMYGDSIVWNDGAIGWNDLPAWVRSLNCAEARRAGTAPDDKRMWLASEVLEMMDEATASGR